MPPWVNADLKMPILCHKFNLVIDLSGRGHENKKWGTTTSAYCILFKNMLLFCQGAFTDVFDETNPPVAPNTTCLGMVFLRNLDSKTLVEKCHADGRISFTMNLKLNDTVTFSLETPSPSIDQAWSENLKACFEHISIRLSETDNAVIQVVFSAKVTDWEAKFQPSRNCGRFSCSETKFCNVSP